MTKFYKSTKKRKHKLPRKRLKVTKKFKYFLLAFVTVAIAIAVILIITLSGRGMAEQPQTADIASTQQILQTPEPMITTSPTPEPTIRKAYIPDPAELQEIPDITTLSLIEDYIETELENDELTIKWAIDENADYYLLCVLGEDNNVLQKDILWPDIGEWMISDYQGQAILILSYKDMGEDSADDDELAAAYFSQIAAAPTHTPSGSEDPSPTEKPKDPSMNKYYIIVDKADNAFAIFTYDENGKYTKKVATFPCALGRSSRHTPTGKFKISSKGAWKTWTGGQYSPFYTRYTSGLYFHGSIYSKKSPDALIAKYYEEIGSNKTSGCVRTTVAGARWVYYNCPAGTVVEIVKSSSAISYPGKPSIDPEYPKWDPTDPDKPESAPDPTPTPTVTPEATPTPIATPAPVKYTVTFNPGNHGALANPDLAIQTVKERESAQDPGITEIDEGYAFDGWDKLFDDIQGDITITAVYHAIEFSLEIVTTGDGTVNINPDQTAYAPGTTVHLTAVDGGGTFSGWTGDANSGDKEIDIVMNSDMKITATFE